MIEDRCPQCGATVGGREGCQALYDEIAVRAYSEPGYASTHDLAFDAYCMQHPARYCRSAKSYAAHLTRLCCGLEHAGSRDVYKAIQKWLNGSVDLKKPELPTDFGRITVADLHAASDAEEHTRLAYDWARSVWEAYASQHDLARSWIVSAMKGER